MESGKEYPASPKVWFITHCLAGMGRHLVEAILQRGDYAAITARDLSKITGYAEQYPQQALTLHMDVTHPDHVQRALGMALERFGRIDVLVNNAGYGLQGALEEVTMEQIRSQFEMNFFGMVEMTRAVLPHMREARRGHIVNISSMAGGMVAVPGLSAYNATKFAVAGLSEALVQELRPLGIEVTVVEMSALHTDWWGKSLIRTENVIEDYMQTRSLSRSGDEGSRSLGDPKLAAAAILQALDAPEPPLHLVLGTDALQKVRRKLEGLQQELEAWEKVAHSVSPEEELR